MNTINDNLFRTIFVLVQACWSVNYNFYFKKKPGLGLHKHYLKLSVN